MTGRGEQEHRIEPQLKGHARLLKDGADLRVNVMAASLARTGQFSLDFVPLCLALKLRADMTLTNPHIKQMGQASVVVWKLEEELPNCVGFHGLIS